MLLRLEGVTVMKKLICMLVVLVLFASCNDDREVDNIMSRSPQPAAGGSIIRKVQNAGTGLDSQQAKQEANQDFSRSRFDKAISVLRRALKKEADNDQLWALYDRALLARTGNDYLESVPKNRYRINMKTFLQDEPFWSTRYVLLDVREPDEFDKGHIQGSINVPFREVLNNLSLLPGPEDNVTLLVICNTQHRANHVIVVLREVGYINAYTLRGGYNNYLSWKKKRQGGKKGGMLKNSEAGDSNGQNGKDLQNSDSIENQPDEDFSC